MNPEVRDEPEPVGRIEPYDRPRHDIAHELTIGAPAAVFRAVTTCEGLATWWTRDCEARPEEGSLARFRFDGGDRELVMRVDLLEFPELVHWECIEGPREWVGTKVAFRIEGFPAADGSGEVSLVRFWHGGWPYQDGLLPRCSFDWAMNLERLRRVLEAPRTRTRS